MIIVLAHIMVKEGTNDDFIKAANICVEETRKEDGCITYVLVTSTEDPQKYTFVEKWSSKEHLDAHMKTAHFKELVAELQNLSAKFGEIELYEVAASSEGII